MVNVLALPVLEIEILISKKFSPIYQQILGKDIFPRGLNFACVGNKGGSARRHASHWANTWMMPVVLIDADASLRSA